VRTLVVEEVEVATDAHAGLVHGVIGGLFRDLRG
jgi:hypothetical protein